MTNFADRLTQAVRRVRTPVLVGLDPRLEQLPDGLQPAAEHSPEDQAKAYVEFCRGVIDVVADLVAVVKPQAAFFEQLGPPGMAALAEVIEYAQQKDLLVIFDGKRNDIGSTATAYADGLLGAGQSAWGADALTISPYLGEDSLSPFVEVAKARSAGLFVLVKTSNPGGGLFQDLTTGEGPVYLHVARLVNRLASETLGECGFGAVGAVVGATYADQLAQLRQAMPQTWILVPGFGAQGGTAADVAGAMNDQGLGAVINSSRAIIFAHRRPEYAQKYGSGRWQDAVREATEQMIVQLRTETPAGKL